MEKWEGSLIVDYNSLKESLEILRRVMVSRKSLLPALEYTLMEFDNGTVKLSGTNLSGYITIAFECESANKMIHHPVCLHVKDLSMALRAIGKSKDIKLTPVYSGSGDEFRCIMMANDFVAIDTLSPDEFPPSLVLSGAIVEVSSHSLARQIKLVAPFASDDSQRETLQCMNLWVQPNTGHVSSSAADGFRIIRHLWLPTKDRRETNSPDIQLLATEMKRLASVIELSGDVWMKIFYGRKEDTQELDVVKFSWYHSTKKLFAHIMYGINPYTSEPIPEYERVAPQKESLKYGFVANRSVLMDALLKIKMLFDTNRDGNWMVHGYVTPTGLYLGARVYDKTMRLKVPILNAKLFDHPELGPVPFGWQANCAFLIEAIEPFQDMFYFCTGSQGAAQKGIPYVITDWSADSYEVTLMGMVSDAPTSVAALGDHVATVDEYKANTEVYINLSLEEIKAKEEIVINNYLAQIEEHNEDLGNFSLRFEYPETELAEKVAERWTINHVHCQRKVMIKQGILEKILIWA